jgi:acyl dehydratase
MSQPHRFFEDFTPGMVLEGGDFEMTEAEILGFARRYDPQPFHLDHAAARASMFGELVASGWNTAAVAMRLMVDHFFGAGGSMGSPGIDELRWPRPVRVGDRLRLRVTVEQARLSKSKPDRGLVHFFTEVLNQDGEAVMTLRGMAFFRARG